MLYNLFKSIAIAEPKWNSALRFQSYTAYQEKNWENLTYLTHK